jgi:anti-sigma factor RsiW
VVDARAPMTECPEQPRIHALADGELPAREAAEARLHLAVCAECRAELAFLLQLAVAVARGVAGFDELEACGAIAAIDRPS